MRKIGKTVLGLCALLAALLFLNNGGDQGYTEADLAQARESAYNEGYQSGYTEGAADSRDAVYQEGFSAGQAEGYGLGRSEGYESGHSEGYSLGAAQQQEADLTAAGDSYRQGYDLGYNDGYAQKLREEKAAAEQYLASLQPTLPEVAPPAVIAPEPEPVPVPQPEPAPEVQPEPVSQTVYVTKSGTKYHLESCSHLSKSKIEKTLAEAKAANYQPCKTCKPPQ